MFNASSTSSVLRCVAIAQPTIRRLHTSITTARYRKPAHVGMYVMSATQSWSGPVAVKARSTRSGAARSSSSRTVVFVHFRRVTPWIPTSHITRATRFRLAPISFGRSAWILGAPYVPSLFLWLFLISSNSSAFAFDRAEGARLSHA